MRPTTRLLMKPDDWRWHARQQISNTTATSHVGLHIAQSTTDPPARQSVSRDETLDWNGRRSVLRDDKSHHVTYASVTSSADATWHDYTPHAWVQTRTRCILFCYGFVVQLVVRQVKSNIPLNIRLQQTHNISKVHVKSSRQVVQHNSLQNWKPTAIVYTT